jgi:hypothetical protein
MSLGQWGVSMVVALAVGGNVLGVVRGTDDWPLSSVPMFHQRFPAGTLPPRYRLVGVRQGVSVPLTPVEFGLHPDQMDARILGRPGVGRTCGTLGDIYNRRHPDVPLTSLHVRIEFVSRPGVARRERPVIVHCPLAGTGDER